MLKLIIKFLKNTIQDFLLEKKIFPEPEKNPVFKFTDFFKH